MKAQIEIDMLEFEENYPKKILLIEDNHKDVTLIKKVISDTFHNSTIVEVPSLYRAYEEYKKQNFNLVLLDLNLPDGYGPASVQEMRRWNKSVPIIVLTSLGNDITLKESLKNGANHFALKSRLIDEEFKNILRQYTN